MASTFWGLPAGEKIGSGGMADIYKIVDRRGEVYVAKVIRPDRISNPLYLQQFYYEADLHPKLEHPHIVRCWKAYLNEPPQGLLLEYIDGMNLRQYVNYLRETKPREEDRYMRGEEILQLMKELSGALDYLHSMGFIHCDLKPENIMRSKDGKFFLMDFGIAQKINTRPDSARGTPTYMAPEQEQGASLDARTDLYSFALTIYELLTGGKSAYVDAADQEGFGTQNSQARGGSHTQAPNLSLFRRNIKPKVNEVLQQALAANPADRFKTVRAFVEAMDRELYGTTRQRATITTTATTAAPYAASLPLVASLVCTNQQIKAFPLGVGNPDVLIGRHADCNLWVKEDRQVSRRHALVQWDQKSGRYAVWDQRSGLGTRVNGKLLKGNGRFLSHGDLLTIGRYNFRFEEANYGRGTS
jgi:serine/threonine protein kinase